MFAFGLWVLTLTPRSRSTKLLAAFAITAGLLYIPFNLLRWTGWELYALWNPFQATMRSLTGLALLGLAYGFLEPVRERARRVRFAASAVVATLVIVPLSVGALTGTIFGHIPFFANLTGWRLASIGGILLSLGLFYGASLAVGIVLAWLYRYPPEGAEETTRVQSAVVSAALALWPAFVASAFVTSLADPTVPLGGAQALGVLSVAGWVILAGVWLSHPRAVPGRSREPRNVAWVILGALLFGTINAVFVTPHFSLPANGPLWGVVRLATVLALGYGILRHQVLGIDAKFRWGVSKTTVAGIFVAVFFIVSEGAQALFADFAGNEFLGVLAAGLLVFAISPLQRFADRFAAKAVPGGAEAGAGVEDRYREAVRAALADDELTREEDRHLARRADELGIGAERAYELRSQVEDELESGGDAG